MSAADLPEEDDIRALAVTRPEEPPAPFILFAGSRYYPHGGWRDYQSRWPTQTEAEIAAEDAMAEMTYGWFHIVDATTWTIVAGGESKREEP